MQRQIVTGDLDWPLLAGVGLVLHGFSLDTHNIDQT